MKDQTKSFISCEFERFAGEGSGDDELYGDGAAAGEVELFAHL